MPDYGPDVGSLVSGTCRPSNFEAGDVFPSPSPSPSSATSLGVFIGTSPNGDWQLYMVDDEVFDAGSIADGWSLTIISGELPPPGSFAGWAAGIGIAGSAVAADPDNDGLPNGAAS